MAYSRPLLGVAIAALIGSGALAVTAHAQGRYWTAPPPEPGQRPYGPPPAYGLAGPGVADLAPPLRETPRGRAFVMRNFDFNHDGQVSRGEAMAANRAFAGMDGAPRGGYGRYREDEAYGAPSPPAPPPPAYAEGNQGELRDYDLRQGREGAVFTLHDVLFETASAQLRPEAQTRLQPLAGFLRDHPRVRLRIDGFTDSVGSDPANLTLSRNRAQSVADALEVMGVDAGRLQTDGHGKTTPAASNATAEGRQLNRRVEVTLLGQRASVLE